MKQKLKAIGNWFVDLFGFNHNTKYVKSYLNAANMRSGIYMAVVIIALEGWMVVRQTMERIIPLLNTNGGNPIEVFYTNTSNFFLLMFLGFSMLLYCIYTIREKKTLKLAITTSVFAAIGLLLFAFINYQSVLGAIANPEAKTKALVTAYLMLSFFVSIALFQISIIFGTFYQYKGGKKEWITSAMIISLFALACLTFGMMVSYTDYFGYAKNPITGGNLKDANGVPILAYKQIICFLMMSLYIGCLLIWKPYISIGLLGAIFTGFHLILIYLPGADRSVQDGDLVNYITFFISLAMVAVSIYAQRVAEARKDEELEILATKDTLTGLLSFEYFCTLAAKKNAEKSTLPNEWIYIFLDITSFKIYNDQRGFAAGNNFLKKVGEILTKYFSDGLITRQSDDHFVLYIKHVNTGERMIEVDKEIQALDADIRPGIKSGGYIMQNKEEDPHRAVEKARYAFTSIKRQGNIPYTLYDQKMHDSYHQIQYVVKHIDQAVEEDWIKVYYQPVVASKTGALCGCEALARWDDPRYGFMSPAVFVGALEDSQLVFKLDVAMLRLVCRDLRKNMDAKLPVVPVSINFSRLDFMILDVPNVIEGILNEYNIPKHMIHVEVTESALLSEGDVLKKAMKELRKKGFALWLDDFGSGYSSFNALKDYEFDVLKLDMQFLKGFEDNPKSKALIKSVIQMADEIGMKTLSEGVETEEQAKFLKKISCGRLQGYLFGKPIPYEEINKRIAKGDFKISKKLLD